MNSFDGEKWMRLLKCVRWTRLNGSFVKCSLFTGYDVKWSKNRKWDDLSRRTLKLTIIYNKCVVDCSWRVKVKSIRWLQMDGNRKMRSFLALETIFWCFEWKFGKSSTQAKWWCVWRAISLEIDEIPLPLYILFTDESAVDRLFRVD